MNRNKIIYGSIGIIVTLMAGAIIISTYNYSDDKFIPSNNLERSLLIKSEEYTYTTKNEGAPLVHIEVSPKNSEPSGTLKINWSAVSTNIASNSWIAVFLYGHKTQSDTEISSFTVNKRASGEDKLTTPAQAGIYEVRYIMDNNRPTIATTGPVVVNPKDSILLVSKTVLDRGEILEVSWDLSEKLFRSSSEENSKLVLCLNTLGAYDDCIWTEEVSSRGGSTKLRLPIFAGYFVVRLIHQVQTWKFLPDMECLLISSIVKVSDSNYEFVSSTKSVVSSTVETDWEILDEEDPDNADWIGLFSLSTTDIFTRSADPIEYSTVKKQRSGHFQAYLPPNSPAGAYVFVYFSKHIPMAVSEIIDIQQPVVTCPVDKPTMSNIKHLVIICTENHSFDSYFGDYCTGQEGTNPNCNTGRDCCEKAPESLEGQSPFVLDDEQNLKFDPNHDMECELCEMNGGKMNGYLKGCYCSNPQNFAVAEFNKTVAILHDYASRFALADRYFQPAAGASSENDMYFARASYVFKNNGMIPTGSVGSNCWYLVHGIPNEYSAYYDPSITGLLAKCGLVLRTYAEGYHNATLDFSKNQCYPNGYDASDIPFNYYAGITDKENFIGDYNSFIDDIKNGTLPEVSFVKPLGRNTAHPGQANISNEVNFVKKTVDQVLNSSYSNDTLILWVPDESGGYYDHIKPPQTSHVDKIPYGPRIPMLAIGKFAKKNYISHEVMEHSSIVKFIEWNWLNGQTGQLKTRDRYVNNIGDMIDPIEAGMIIPN